MKILNLETLIEEVNAKADAQELENGINNEYYDNLTRDIDLLENLEDYLITDENGYLTLKDGYDTKKLSHYDYNVEVEVEEDDYIEDYKVGDVIYTSIYKINDYKTL